MSIEEIIKALRRGLFSDTLLQLAADTIEKLESERNRQQAETKTLQERNVILRGVIDSQKAENERLQKLLDDKCDRCIARTKAEAFKEFARTLKCGVPQETGIIRCADIDNLLKEKVGEKGNG